MEMVMSKTTVPEGLNSFKWSFNKAPQKSFFWGDKNVEIKRWSNRYLGKYTA